MGYGGWVLNVFVWGGGRGGGGAMQKRQSPDSRSFPAGISVC